MKKVTILGPRVVAKVTNKTVAGAITKRVIIANAEIAAISADNTNAGVEVDANITGGSFPFQVEQLPIDSIDNSLTVELESLGEDRLPDHIIFRTYEDSVGLLDSFYRVFSKNNESLVESPDSYLNNALKELITTVTIVDANANNTYRDASDSVNHSETTQNSSTKQAAENTQIVQGFAQDLSRQNTENTSSSDAIIVSATDESSSLTNAGDQLAFVLRRAFDEIVGVSEVFGFSIEDRPADIICEEHGKYAASDYFAGDYVVLENIQDIVILKLSKALSDDTSVSETIARYLNQSIADETSAGEDVRLLFSKLPSELITQNELISTLKHAYTNGTYMPIDYVGELRNLNA